MRRLILYDLDGTLVDTLEDITAAANHMLAELQLPPRSAREIRGYIGRGLHQLVAACLQTDDRRRIEQGTKIYRAYYTQHLADRSRLYPGVREVLDHFRARQQAVISNKPNPYSRDLLRALGVADYFFEIVGGEMPYPKKPNPASVLAMMKRSQAAAGQTVFIGDSSIDIEAGRKAGVVTVGVSHGFAETGELEAAAPDVLVRDFRELLERAGREGW